MGFSVNQRNSLRSPHVRGKDTRRQRDDSVRGITPACAGKSWRPVLGLKCSRDHPRVCGEKGWVYYRTPAELGSPPRVRGKECGKARRAGAEGITPACAGKSRRWPLRSAPAWDHPRVCGEKRISCFCASRMVGSPPRVRGKVRGLFDVGVKVRITPACAGKRQVVHDELPWLEDHPRVCGEK